MGTEGGPSPRISPWDQRGIKLGSTLARLEAALDLVDHIDPALAADQAVVAVATTQRFSTSYGPSWENPGVLKGRIGQPKVAKQNTIEPAGGHAARDGRFLSHGAVECQSEGPAPDLAARNRSHNWALAQKNIILPLRRAANAARRANSGPFRWHIDCFID